MYLEVATEAGAAAQGLAAEAATRAGRAGATYADLGKSAGITRQAARKRWPDAVGTQWSLFLLTGKSHPHGLNVKVFRSRGRAIDAGRTAVDDGALSHDGAIAAVVVDSSRRTAWAYSFNSSTWGPQEITLPEKLQTVPTTSDAGHSNWVQQWT
ncbi:hypothetical protein ACGF3K_33590 [Streptomyces sp. NPDC047980]|uniref:hypothetical protein n=1 Tax=Streptomyces sp. NPDC047980 TaxID=3365494 RepID=UPI00371EE367